MSVLKDFPTLLLLRQKSKIALNSVSQNKNSDYKHTPH